MKSRPIAVACLLLVLGPPVLAEKLSNEFKIAFEQTFRPKRTYAVVLQEGIPTTSVYGIEGNQTDAHYSIDVEGGRWRTSEGLLDTAQTAADTLNKGEVMELASISYKDNRVDLRMVSLEAHKVRRGNVLFKTDKREPVATNFKFFLPFDKSRYLTPSDVPAVVKYIESLLKAFPDEDAARTFSARMATGQVPRAQQPAPAAPAAKASQKEIKAGMTALQVIEILGKPQQELTFGAKTRWTYPDLTVIFENGKVSEVKF